MLTFLECLDHSSVEGLQLDDQVVDIDNESDQSCLNVVVLAHQVL